jgi:hypothetical protein
MPVVEIVVDDDDGPVVPAERTPADIVLVVPPVNPGGAPVVVGDPVPAEADPPMPPPVVVDGPAPGFERDPVPADHGIPDPTAVKIGPPVDVDRVRGPDVSVRLFIDPVAAPVEFLLVVVEIGREVPGIAPLGEKVVPGSVPLVEFVGTHQEPVRLPGEAAVDRGDLFLRPDEEGSFLSGRFGGSLEDEKLGFLPRPDVDPVEPHVEEIKRGVGSVNFDAFFDLEPVHPEVNASLEDMKLDPVVTFSGQQGEFDLGILADTEKVPVAEMNLGLADLRPDLVSLDQSQVDLSLFIAEVRGSLDENIATDVIQAGETRGVVAFGILGRAPGHDEEEGEGCEKRFFHRPSPFHAFLKSNIRAISSRLESASPLSSIKDNLLRIVPLAVIFLTKGPAVPDRNAPGPGGVRARPGTDGNKDGGGPRRL